MNHMPRETWLAYVRGVLTPEERDGCDTHLAEDCATCFEIYLEALEELAEVLPQPDTASLQASVMKQWDIEHRSAAFPPARQTGIHLHPRSWFQHPLLHYGVAAAITMLLMGTGTFQFLMGSVSAAVDPDHPDLARPAAETEPYSVRWMEKTVGLLDRIESKREREDNR
ncbi:zf-HC2 domain-containing protein [Paenibacillus sp. S-38]|uniref:zf-HC2 domain-containing protein n=1 Tax=Paenibacillus sp. S-38 TaxID=3416710 RepID=UPI003CECB3C1